MPKPLKSQWEFGELFPPEATRKVFSVTEVTLSIKRVIEKEIGEVWVTGEITNLRAQSSGHIYFSIKDGNAQLSCVLFRGEARAARRDLLQDGQKVVLRGGLSVYEARGQYQLIVTEVEFQGAGALQIAFEKLKQKLNAEGLFAAARKRPLPRFPRRLGIATSATGAVLHDVLRVIQRRAPSLEAILTNCRVQGQGAAGEIACAIAWLNEWSAAQPRGSGLDAILVTRGGGSLEDLWAFNEEIVARAIFHSQLPVISAVGHEIDFTISDFTADFRASTPTAAAEILTEELFRAVEKIIRLRSDLACALQSEISTRMDQLMVARERMMRVHPRRHLQEQAQLLDDLQLALQRCARTGLRFHHARCREGIERLLRVRPSQALAREREALLRMQRLLHERARLQLAQRQTALAALEERLRLLSPVNVLERGYSITFNADTGAVIHAVEEVADGQRLRTRLRSGEIESVANKKQ